MLDQLFALFSRCLNYPISVYAFVCINVCQPERVCFLHTFLVLSPGFQACKTFSNSHLSFSLDSLQSIIWLLLPALVCCENKTNPRSSKIDFHGQVVFTFEIVRSTARLSGFQECTLFNRETPDKSQAVWTTTPGNSRRIKIKSIKRTGQKQPD